MIVLIVFTSNHYIPTHELYTIWFEILGVSGNGAYAPLVADYGIPEEALTHRISWVSVFLFLYWELSEQCMSVVVW
jgi:hypothetical protein